MTILPDVGDAGARARLQKLLCATTSVVERLDLEVVLSRIIEASVDLVDARSGAIGVIDPDGDGLERFIHVGTDAETAADPRSSGIPDPDASTHALLRVPIRVGDHLYGTLYLTEGAHGPFTVADEALIVALAATAGIAIENARLYDTARVREAWSTTAADVMAAMLAAGDKDALEVIIDHVGDLLNADAVAVSVPSGDDEVRVVVARGEGAASVIGRSFPMAGSLASAALTSQRAARVESRAAPSPDAPSFGPTVALPLFAGEELLGILYVSRSIGRASFTDTDLQMAFVFAAQASVAIEILRARKGRWRLERSDDRARIARDLHDLVIQRLYGAGLALQAISAAVDPASAATIASQVDTLDDAIKSIRTVIFALGSQDRIDGRLPRDRMLDVVTTAGTKLAETPRLTFSGPVDSLVSDALADDITDVLRICLADIVDHADAANVAVELSVADGVVLLTVEDDGIVSSGRLDAGAVVGARARQRGGSWAITATASGGTRVDWAVPID